MRKRVTYPTARRLTPMSSRTLTHSVVVAVVAALLVPLVALGGDGAAARRAALRRPARRARLLVATDERRATVLRFRERNRGSRSSPPGLAQGRAALLATRRPGRRPGRARSSSRAALTSPHGERAMVEVRKTGIGRVIRFAHGGPADPAAGRLLRALVRRPRRRSREAEQDLGRHVPPGRAGPLARHARRRRRPCPLPQAERDGRAGRRRPAGDRARSAALAALEPVSR